MLRQKQIAFEDVLLLKVPSTLTRQHKLSLLSEQMNECMI